jgi:hypothetical protein
MWLYLPVVFEQFVQSIRITLMSRTVFEDEIDHRIVCKFLVLKKNLDYK